MVSGLGVLVGEKVLSRNAAYVLSIIAALFPTLPIGLVGLGERPPTRYPPTRPTVSWSVA